MHLVREYPAYYFFIAGMKIEIDTNTKYEGLVLADLQWSFYVPAFGKYHAVIQ